jgi:hypothetical protein
MMDWEQVEMSAEFQRLVERLEDWTKTSPGWPAFQSAEKLFAAVAPRLREMQTNLGRVLIVALVGGTGVGKSSLINALVGRDTCKTGDRRPTTCRPVVLCHRDVDPSFLRFEAEEVELHRLEIPLLEEMVLVDCPDPDTQGFPATENRNLDILRKVLPHCDVILYVGSAQKYKTQAVQQEVLAHVHGRSILFVQSRAKLDHDIREDWKAELEQAGFSVPRIFLVDSVEALDCQYRGAETPEEFERLRQWLRFDIARRARHRIKRANALDLLDHLAKRIENEIQGRVASVAKLQDAIAQQRRAIFAQVKQHLRNQLDAHRSLWHQRLKKELINSWGGGLFIGLARLSAGIGSLFNMLLLLRVRTPVQLLLAGGAQAGKVLGDLARQQNETSAWITAADLGVNDAELVEARSILQGFARDAELVVPEDAMDDNSPDQRQAEQLQAMARQLYGHVESGLDAAVTRQVARKAGPLTRWTVETLFIALVAYLLFLLGRNFFYDRPWLGAPLLGLDFLIYSAFWAIAWGWLLHWLLMRRLRRGLRREIAGLLDALPAETIVGSLYRDLDRACDKVQAHAARLGSIAADIVILRRQFGQIEDVGVGQGLV